MFSYVFSGIFGDVLAPRPSKRKEIWAFLKAGLFEKALIALRTPQHGFDPNEREDKTGMTALHYASAAGKLDLVVELLVQGAEISSKDNAENTALHFAAQNEHRAVVEVLLRYGADPSVPNETGNVAVEMTRNPAITELFLRDKTNIFSPVVQANRLFAEFLSQQQQQQHHQQNQQLQSLEARYSSGGSYTTTDSKSVQGGDTPNVSLDSGFDLAATPNKGLNLDSEFSDAFSKLSIQSSGKDFDTNYTLVGVTSAQKPAEDPTIRNNGGYQPINAFSPILAEKSHSQLTKAQSPMNNDNHNNINPSLLHTPSYQDPAISFLSPSYSQQPAMFLPSQSSLLMTSGGYANNNQTNTNNNHNTRTTTGNTALFSPDNYQNYQNQMELNQALIVAAQETARAKWHLPIEEFDARKKMVYCCQKFNETTVRSYLAYDPSLPMARLVDLENLAADGQTPLHAAAAFGCLPALKLFLELGSNVSVWVRDLQGRTPLHLAAEKGHTEVCAFLRQKMREERQGADPVGIRAPADIGGTTPLGWAKKMANGRPKLDIEKVLFDRGDASVLQHTPHEKRVGKSPWKSNLFSHSVKENVIYGFSEAQGWSPKMEDRVSIACPVYGRPAWSFFAVFDGHGGVFTATFLAQQFPMILSELAAEAEKEMNSHLLPGGVSNDIDTTPELLERILTQTCVKIDDQLQQHPRMKITKSGASFNVKDSSGSTGIMALVTSAYIAVANVGDSRAVLAKKSQDISKLAELRGDPFAGNTVGTLREENAFELIDEAKGFEFESPSSDAQQGGGGDIIRDLSGKRRNSARHRRRSSLRCALEAFAMSKDHKATIPEERERAIAAGAKVNLAAGEEGHDSAVYEVYTDAYIGRLRMTRSFGDFYLKKNKSLPAEQQAVIAAPEVKVHPRNNSDAFLVLACDGIWDVMNNQQVVDFIGEGLGFTAYGGPVGGINPQAAATVCDDLLAECLSRGSYDNMTVILIIPSPPPTPPSEDPSANTLHTFTRTSFRAKSPVPTSEERLLGLSETSNPRSRSKDIIDPDSSGLKSISSIKNEIDISQYQLSRNGGPHTIHSIIPMKESDHSPPFPPSITFPPSISSSLSAEYDVALHQTPATKKEKSRKKSVLQQVFEPVDYPEEGFDDGIASPLNTAAGTSRVRKQLQYE